MFSSFQDYSELGTEYGGSILPASMGVNPPDIYVNLKTNQAQYKSGAIVGASSVVTVSRASAATQQNAAGVWSSVASNQLARSDLGASIWESRTNSIRNNTMAGAVVMADGVELTTNGNFAAQGTGWTVGTAGAGGVVFTTGNVAITGDGSTNGNYISQQISGLIVGRSYVVILAGSPSFPNDNIGVGTSAGNASVLAFTTVSPNGANSTNSDRVAFTATQTSLWVTISHVGGNTHNITSISVQDGERAQNGGFTSSPLNAAQSTVQNGWQWRLSPANGTCSVTYVGGNSVQLLGDGTNTAQLCAAIPTVSGFTYMVTADIGNSAGNLSVGTTVFASNLLNVFPGVGVGQKFQFTATTTTSYITFSKGNTPFSSVANVSVQSAGALPTNWNWFTPGLALQVVNIGVRNGVSCIDIRAFGTTTTQYNTLSAPEFGNNIAATYGQTWTASAFIALVGGTFNNLLGGAPIAIGIQENNSGGSYVGNSSTPVVPTSTLTRYAWSYTPPDATAAFAQEIIYLQGAHASGDAVDVTIRIGWPQLEFNPLVNSTVASATIAAAGSGGVAGPSAAVYSVAGPGPVLATLNVTVTGGAISAINSVANPGSYTTFPIQGAALTYVSGAGSGVVGATVNCTPTNNASQAAVSPPILTSSAAVTRNAEADTLVLTGLPAFGSAYTLWARCTPLEPTATISNQFLLEASDGTSNNRAVLNRLQGTANYLSTSGGTTQNPTGGVMNQGVSSKFAMSDTAGAQAASLNGAAVFTSAGALPISVNSVNLGVNQANTGGWADTNLEEVAIWFTTALSNATLQAITIGDVPVILTPPVISGTQAIGNVLTTTNGTWLTNPTTLTFTYQWQNNGVNIGGATSSTYLLQGSDATASIRCIVTANNFGSTATATSNALVIMSTILPPALQNAVPDIWVSLKTNQASYLNGTVTTALSAISVTRATPATQVDSGGNWNQFSTGQLARTDLGASIWEARTNSIRNCTMAGAVVMANGVELTTNGTFTPAGGAGWTSNTAGGGAVDFTVSGQVTITGDGSTNNNYITQQVTGLIVGRSYVVSIAGGNHGTFNISVGNSANDTTLINHAVLKANGAGDTSVDRTAFTATATSHWVTLSRNPATGSPITSISVQDGERVQNGGFTANPLNASQSTVQNGWQWSLNTGAGTVTYVGGNSVQIVGDTIHNSQFGTAAIPTVSGFTYTITADITGQSVSVIASTAAMGGGSNLLSVASGITTGQKFQFTATTGTTYLMFQKTANGTTTIANVSVQSAGALPTNWAASNNDGLLRTVVNVGTTQGINYIDFRLNGTTTGTSGNNLNFDTSTTIAATYGQTWSLSAFLALVGGSIANLTSTNFVQNERNSGGSAVQTDSGSSFLGSLTGTLSRSTYSATLGNTATAFDLPQISFAYGNAAAVDMTLRIGWPQLENNSLINSTVASAAIAAAGSGGTAGTAVYSIGGGTGTAATLNVTIAGGVLSAVNSVASAGSYTVFPPSPAALTYVSGTGTGLTGATVTLTPTNLAALAAASPPILTSSAAVTRANELDALVLTGLPAYGGTNITLYASGNPQMPTASTTSQYILNPENTATNRATVFRNSGTGVASGQSISTAGGTSSVFSATAWAQGADGKIACVFNTADFAVVFNGGTPGTNVTDAPPVSFVTYCIGSSNQGSNRLWNGNIYEVAIWTNQRLPNATLQAITT